MTPVDRQLVQQIADQVMAALAQRSQAEVRPPAGLCTASEPSNPPAARTPEAAPPEPSAPLLSGIITANQLSDALAAAKGGPVMLATEARLTPLAQDLARRHASRLNRANTAGAEPTLRQLTGGLPWWWWTCGSTDTVKQVVGERRRRFLPSSVQRSGRALGEAMMDLARSLDTGRVAGGVVFVSQAARAMCLANRFRSIRAILGHCDQSVRQGIEEIGANVLVLEFTHTDVAAMAHRVDLFTTTPRNVPAEMRRFLAQAER